MTDDSQKYKINKGYKQLDPLTGRIEQEVWLTVEGEDKDFVIIQFAHHWQDLVDHLKQDVNGKA